MPAAGGDLDDEVARVGVEKAERASEFQASVVIDRAAPQISEDPEHPFFEGDDLSPPVKEHVEFCSRHASYTQATQEFCQRMVKMEMLSGQQAQYKSKDGTEEKPLASYVAIDPKKLDALDTEGLIALHRDGLLAAVYAHCFSLENWMRLLERRKRLGLPDMT